MIQATGDIGTQWILDLCQTYDIFGTQLRLNTWSNSEPEVSADEDARYPRDMTSTLLPSVLTADDDTKVIGRNDVSFTSPAVAGLTQYISLLTIGPSKV